MKKNIINKIAADLVYETAVKQANSSCTFFFYQPKLPEKVKKLRKF